MPCLSRTAGLVLATLLIASSCLAQSTVTDGESITTHASSLPADNATAASITSSAENAWPTLAGNPGRTSWTAEEVRGRLQAVWYRPIEPYINYKVQVVAAGGLLYISTSGGLYALRADNGAIAWVYPTEMPLGHSPTVADGVVYVGGYDGRIYALEAQPDVGSLPVVEGVRVNDRLLWTYAADAGFETNPLVVGGRVYAGSRGGCLYALDAATGARIWKYVAGSPITYSAAYADGVVFFASADGRAHALRTTGELLWKTDRLPGAGFHSYWPVIYKDYVIFAGSTSYGFASGLSVGALNNKLDRDAVYGVSTGTVSIGPKGNEPGDWVDGTVTFDAQRVTEYYENMPWRRTYFVLDRQTGQELTFDSDGDGRPEYAPILWTGTHSGNRYPPIVAGDGVLYQQQNYFSGQDIPGGQVSGWEFGTQYISQVSRDWQAVDEPQAYSAGGDLIYWANCCDREAGAFDVTTPLGNADREWKYYDYDLGDRLPGYWLAYSGPYRSGDWGLSGTYGGQNGVYGTHGTQNPPIPYGGLVYKIAGNAVIAFGPAGSRIALPVARAVDAEAAPVLTSRAALRERLAQEIRKMISAGHLRPGYHNSGLPDRVLGHDSNSYLAHYFHNPADTFITLSRALALPDQDLSIELKEQIRAYLQREYADYGQYVHTGWQTGAAREAYAVPPEVQERMSAFRPQTDIYGSSWDDRYRVYGLWKYAEQFGGAKETFAGIRGKMPIVNPGLDSVQSTSDEALAFRSLLPLQVNRASMPEMVDLEPVAPVPAQAPGTYAYHPYILNAYIAGYLGYLGLEQLAGEPESTAMRAELDRLLALRAASFSANSAYAATTTYHNVLNVADNFMYMVPELADYLHDHTYFRVKQAVDEYSRVAPCWFVAGYDATYLEGATQHLFDPVALFQAKAQILREPYSELVKYLDVPAFAVGDLYYIQNLVALLQAPD